MSHPIHTYLRVATWWAVVFCALIPSKAAADSDFGFFYDQFPLTLNEGQRVEAAGPFFYSQQSGSDRRFAVPPLFSHVEDAAVDAEEFDILYPLLTYDRFGREYRWQLGQLLSLSGGRDQKDDSADRFTLFPIYFQQRSPDTNLNYTALFPIYGQLKGRLFRSEIEFVLWPLYVKTKRRPSASAMPDKEFEGAGYRFLSSRRGELTTYNFVYPFFHLRYGDDLKGWQFWPFAGHEHKGVTTFTNSWGDVATVPGHEKRFVLWPFYFDEHRGIGSENPEHQQTFLPFYNYLRSPQRDSTTYFWPIGPTITDDRARKYREVDAPWPFIVFARGEGKHTSRVWPFFSQSSNAHLRSDFYLWPVYTYHRLQSAPLDRGRTRILLYLYSDTIEKNTETGAFKRRADFWPFYTWRHELNGDTRLQIFSPLEPFVPQSKSIERNYSPLWSVWRYEHNAGNGNSSQSLLWNLYRYETAVSTRKCSLLFGLFQYQSDAETRTWRLFHLPVLKTRPRPGPSAEPAP